MRSVTVKEAKMLKKIVIALAAIIAIFLIVVAMQPSEFRVERSTKIAAPAKTVFAQVNDLHKWDAWSPWVEARSGCQDRFRGTEVRDRRHRPLVRQQAGG